MAGPSLNGSFRGRASSAMTSRTSLKKPPVISVTAKSWRRKQPATCVASPSDPKEPPGRKPVILRIEFHIFILSMSNGDLAFR